MNKNEIILKIVLLVIVASIVTSFIVFAIVCPNQFQFSLGYQSSKEVIYQKDYSQEEIESIAVDNKSVDVFLEKSNDSNIHLKVYGEKKRKNKYEINLENKKLQIKRKGEVNFCIGFCSYEERIILYLPEEYEKDIKINSLSGDITTRNQLAVNLDIITKSGDILSEEINQLKANTISGDIQVKRVTMIELKTTSGDVEIDSLMLLKNSKIRTISGDVLIDRVNDIYIETNTMSGDVEVVKNNRYANILLSVTTTSGNIEIG